MLDNEKQRTLDASNVFLLVYYTPMEKTIVVKIGIQFPPHKLYKPDLECFQTTRHLLQTHLPHPRRHRLRLLLRVLSVLID